jgi:hypothetical protein
MSGPDTITRMIKRTVQSSLLGLLLTSIACAQMSPEDAQRFLDEAKSEQGSVAATDTVEPTPRRLAQKFDELSVESKMRLKRFAQHSIRIGGDIWSNEAERDRERQTARLRRVIDDDLYTFTYDDGRTSHGFVDPYEVYGAPVYLCLSDDRKLLNIESIQNAIRRQTLKQADAIFTPFIIDQVLDNGVRARWGHDEFFVEIDTGGLVEDQKLEAVMRDVGTFEYITVQGASRTIKKYRVIDLKFDTKASPVTASELFEFMVKTNRNHLPIYRPQANIEKRPVTKAGGGQVRGRYSWDWRLIEQPIDMYAENDSR